MITIRPDKNPTRITTLNRELQNWHAELKPDFFKKFDFEKIYPSIEKMLAKDTTHAFIAYEDNLPIGYVLFMEQILEETAFHYALRSVLIDQMGVLPAFQRRGIGLELMTSVERFARRRGFDYLELTVWAVNANAQRFYERCGFEQRLHYMQKKL